MRMKLTMSLREKQNLLIISDDDQVGRLVKKLFERDAKDSFDEILTAASSQQAEEICKYKPITSIISDYELGKNQPTGTVLIKDLRSKYSSIQAAYIYTGAPGAVEKSAEIDAVLLKTGLDFHKLIEAVVGSSLRSKLPNQTQLNRKE